MPSKKKSAEKAKVPALKTWVDKSANLQKIKSLLSFDYAGRVRLAVFMIVGLLLFTHVWGMSRKDFDLSDMGRDGISVYEGRFAGLKNTFTSTGVVSYISDAEPYNIEFYLTQYALTPVTVDPKNDHEFVVSNYSNKLADQKNPITKSLALVHDYGNGVKLYRHESK